ncbi:MAG: MCE family protein [Actinomycetota bacterium]|nr:MCE family protein [Actinomycetota bacterium]
MKRLLRRALMLGIAVCALLASGCEWRGLNSLPLPGTAGGGPNSYSIKVQLPDVTNLQENSRVRVGDVTVGNVVKIERQAWHALVTLQLAGDVELPDNATAKIGQTSLLGSVHVELAPPAHAEPVGRLHDGSLIRLTSGGSYPTTEQTLAAASLLLNSGGIARLQDITHTLSQAFGNNGNNVRALIGEIDTFVGHLDDQSGDIIDAAEKLNSLMNQFAEQKPKLDVALEKLPVALKVLNEQRANLVDTVDKLGKFAGLTTSVVNGSKENLVAQLKELGPILQALANAGPAMTRSLSNLATYPWPNETLPNWVRGDYANLSLIVDLTLSRIDAGLFTGTRWEGDLTELELQWGRTIGQFPSPYTAGNPLTVPYRWNQGP